MYLILTPDYPDENNVNRFAYIHSRVRVYKENNLKFQVFVLKEDLPKILEYEFEGLNIICGNKDTLVDYINKIEISKILIQFINIPIINALKVVGKRLPIYIWFHGYEALSWKRRLFNINTSDLLSIPRFIKYIYNNNKQIKHLKNFLAQENERVHAIAVSNWMKNVVETDVKCKIINWSIIPNIIDSNIFNFQPKDINQRKKILLVRSFESKKYANDISIKFIKSLSEKDYFNELDILIIGKGMFFNQLTKQVAGFKNVTIKNTFLNHFELAQLYKEYGVFLCPTRQDSQGVSMCEAMASGLVPLTSNNTAIPEFVSLNSGYMSNDIDEMVNNFEELYHNEEIFIKMSKEASISILEKCSYKNTVAKEIELIKS